MDTAAAVVRFVSFRFVGFDAGRPLLRGTSFWGFRTNVSSLTDQGILRAFCKDQDPLEGTWFVLVEL